ncbi:hypothetical protein Rcae01_00197 [Novipirellula caenicola]|uniref:Uncharacterized protein n=1 Tax=Novipirellula caenicola TaxID=1536901 RepID=A0ABP9VMX2_9BACT
MSFERDGANFALHVVFRYSDISPKKIIFDLPKNVSFAARLNLIPWRSIPLSLFRPNRGRILSQLRVCQQRPRFAVKQSRRSISLFESWSALEV